MRRREGRLHHAIGPAQQFAAGMEQLHEDLCAFGVDRIEQAPERRDAVIRRAHQQRLGIARGFVDADDLDDDEPGPAPGAGALIGDQRIGRQAAFGQIGVMPGREDAVADLGGLEGEGRKEMWETA